MKVTRDEIRFIGLVNNYKDGKFYVNVCEIAPLHASVEISLTEQEIPLINDTLYYPSGLGHMGMSNYRSDW